MIQLVHAYFSVVEPAKCNVDGLMKYLGKAMELMGIKDVLNKEVLGVEGHPVLRHRWVPLKVLILE